MLSRERERWQVPPNVSLFSLLSIFYCRLLAGSIAAFYGTGVLCHLSLSLAREHGGRVAKRHLTLAYFAAIHREKKALPTPIISSHPFVIFHFGSHRSDSYTVRKTMFAALPIFRLEQKFNQHHYIVHKQSNNPTLFQWIRSMYREYYPYFIFYVKLYSTCHPSLRQGNNNEHWWRNGIRCWVHDHHSIF